MNWIMHRWVQVVLVWGVLVIALSLSAMVSGSVAIIRSDDAMRLVGAIDLLNGQSWFDTTQYRDNTPFGAPMHWSRLVDAPLVLLIALFKPFAGEAAPYWAAFAWPLIVLFAVVALLADLAERLAGKTARVPALAMLALSVVVYTEFIPGRVDHHNVQIALTLAMIIASLQGRSRTLWAVAAGFIAATGLAIGTEVLPAVLAVLICFSLYWLVEPGQSRPQILAFAASFPTSLLFHVGLVTRPDAWLSPACDALSMTYVIAGVCYGVAMLLAVLLAPLLRHWPLRLLVLAGLAVASAAVMFWLFPECRGGPYGNLDAELAAVLFPQIGEAQTIWAWANDFRLLRPDIVLILTPLTGMAMLLFVTARAPATQRWRWLVLTGFCGGLFVVSCLQIRGFRLLTIALLPGSAWAALWIWKWFRARQTVASAVIAGVAISAMTGALQWSLFTYAYAGFVPKRPDISMVNWDKCLEPEVYEPLAALPPGRLMSFMLIGPQLLFETPHSIVAAGYHRNEAGLRDLLRFYAGGEVEARSVVRERGLDYLVFCNGLPASGGLAGVPDFEGTSWPWLVRVSAPDAPLQIYAIE
jgi:hypothetical protein